MTVQFSETSQLCVDHSQRPIGLRQRDCQIHVSQLNVICFFQKTMGKNDSDACVMNVQKLISCLTKISLNNSGEIYKKPKNAMFYLKHAGQITVGGRKIYIFVYKGYNILISPKLKLSSIVNSHGSFSHKNLQRV